MRMSSTANRPLPGWADAIARFAVTIFIVPMVVLSIGAIQTVEGQSENGWRQSWNNSPGALLLLASLDHPDKQKEGIAALVQKAKLLYEDGKFDEAEAMLVQVLKEDPSNPLARYYGARIREVRAKAQLTGVPRLIPLATNNPVFITVSREEILSKLNRIHLDEVGYDLPLTEVLKRLRFESQKRDPDGVGINFLINPYDPASGVNMGTVKIKISPPLQNLRLVDVLNAITMTADQPIKYSIEDYAVVFSPKPIEQETLYSKVFKVDPRSFVQNLQRAYVTNVSTISFPGDGDLEMYGDPVGPGDGHDALGGPIAPPMRIHSVTKTNESLQLDKMLRDYFTAAGVNLTEPGKSVFFNDRSGLLLVRASAQDLEIVQKDLDILTWKPPQVVITAKFVELSKRDSDALGFNWFLQGNSVSSNTMTGVMSDQQYRIALNAIEHWTGKDILSLPRVTTLSGREAHISSSDGGAGQALDVIANVQADGFAIQTTAIPTLILNHGARHRQVAVSSRLWDGQTLVIGIPGSDQPPVEGNLELIFVTPRIIDPAGNVVHTDDELSREH